MEVLEELGWMDYLANAQGHRLFALDVSRIKHWLALGVYPTKPVAMALGSYIIFSSIILEKCQKKNCVYAKLSFANKRYNTNIALEASGQNMDVTLSKNNFKKSRK